MGVPVAFKPEKLVVGILTTRPHALGDQLRDMETGLGRVDFQSDEIPFTFTSYYSKEMGPDIRRVFVSFATLVEPQRLADVKLFTNSLEDAWRESGNRKTNLDPGLLSLNRFVLATTKDGSHRIPLSKGIYAEVTLTFEKGSFKPAPWTYPDYASAPYIAILNSIRSLYRDQIRSWHS